MRYLTPLLCIAGISCGGPVCNEAKTPPALTRVEVMDGGNNLLVAITEPRALAEITRLWRDKTPAPAGTAVTTDHILRLLCSDGTESLWLYDKTGYVQKQSERDHTVYAIGDAHGLLRTVSVGQPAAT